MCVWLGGIRDDTYDTIPRTGDTVHVMTRGLD